MTYCAPERPMPREPRRTIRRGELLHLIEDNGGPEGLDLRDASFIGDGPSPWPWENPIDLSPGALARERAARRDACGTLPAPTQAGSVSLTRAQLQGAIL